MRRLFEPRRSSKEEVQPGEQPGEQGRRRAGGKRRGRTSKSLHHRLTRLQGQRTGKEHGQNKQQDQHQRNSVGDLQSQSQAPLVTRYLPPSSVLPGQGQGPSLGQTRPETGYLPPSPNPGLPHYHGHSEDQAGEKQLVDRIYQAVISVAEDGPRPETKYPDHEHYNVQRQHQNTDQNQYQNGGQYEGQSQYQTEGFGRSLDQEENTGQVEFEPTVVEDYGDEETEESDLASLTVPPVSESQFSAPAGRIWQMRNGKFLTIGLKSSPAAGLEAEYDIRLGEAGGGETPASSSVPITQANWDPITPFYQSPIQLRTHKQVLL